MQDFLRAARSVGNPGVKHDAYKEVGWLFKTRKPKGAGYWYAGPRTMARCVIVRTDGTWGYDTYLSGWDSDPSGFEIGRGPKGLYCNKYATGNIAAAVGSVQRDLIALVRENGIPLPD